MNENDIDRYVEERIKKELKSCPTEYLNALYEKNVKEISFRASEIEKRIRRVAEAKNS